MRARAMSECIGSPNMSEQDMDDETQENRCVPVG